MKKITELTATVIKPVYKWDEYGNRYPEEQEFTYMRPVETADTGIRFAHMFLDSIGVQVLIQISSYIFEAAWPTWFPSMHNVIVLIIIFIVCLLYFPAYYILTEYKWQRTPAKFLTKTLVIDEYGNKPDLRTIVARNIFRFVPFDGFSFLGEGRRGWHDRWSNTWVVTEGELARLRQLQAEQQDAV